MHDIGAPFPEPDLGAKGGKQAFALLIFLRQQMLPSVELLLSRIVPPNREECLTCERCFSVVLAQALPRCIGPFEVYTQIAISQPQYLLLRKTSDISNLLTVDRPDCLAKAGRNRARICFCALELIRSSRLGESFPMKCFLGRR